MRQTADNSLKNGLALSEMAADLEVDFLDRQHPRHPRCHSADQDGLAFSGSFVGDEVGGGLGSEPQLSNESNGDDF